LENRFQVKQFAPFLKVVSQAVAKKVGAGGAAHL